VAGAADTAETELIRQVLAWHGVRLAPAQGKAMAAELARYGELTQGVLATLRFEDEPAHLILVLCGRYGTRAGHR
jgi:hypothetical protein